LARKEEIRKMLAPAAHYMHPNDFKTASHIEELKASDALILEFGFNSIALDVAIDKFELSTDPKIT